MAASRIPFTRLVDFVTGNLSPDERAHLRDQIQADPRAAAEVEQIQRVIDLMRTDTTEHAPPHVIARAVRLFPSRPAQSQPHIRQRILATLQFDSHQHGLAFGVRAGQTTERQVLFAAGDYDLVLRIMPAGSAWAISGQLLGALTEAHVELQGPTFTTQTALNQLGEFKVASIPPGNYRLTVYLSSAAITIPGLDIGR